MKTSYPGRRGPAKGSFAGISELEGILKVPKVPKELLCLNNWPGVKWHPKQFKLVNF